MLHWLWRLDDPLRAVGVVLGLGLGGLLLKPLLAWRMLRNEVKAVDQALDRSLEEARAQLSRLVSRDTQRLDATAVREAAIETLAENLNDSVVAPLFWFAVAGLPGAALYRFANTADAMWGYRGEWEWAGKWAARADDLLSWLPARLTAWLLGLAAGQRHAWRGLPDLGVQARRTPSPNGGWPMGAMALLLGCRLGKPGVYLLNEGGRPVGGAEHLLALLWAGRVVALLALLAAAVAVLAFAVTMSAELGWAAALTAWGSSPRAPGVWSVPVVP
jgi:adenosylcobinamide-phosphate synthase